MENITNKDEVSKSELIERLGTWTPAKITPPKDGLYLCLGHAKSYFLCHYHRGQWWRQSFAKRVDGITHWMHLPEPEL